MPKGAGKVDQQRGKGVVGEGAKDSGEAPGRRIAARRHSFFGVSLSLAWSECRGQRRWVPEGAVEMLAGGWGVDALLSCQVEV